jgi:hypothetical protein
MRLPYELRYRIDELAPYGGLYHMEGEEFVQAYRARLDRIGAEAIRARFAEIIALERQAGNVEPALVLLCYEDVLAGQGCHRRDFAQWYFEQTGVEIPELPAG